MTRMSVTAACAMALVLVGCIGGSSPNSDFYVLYPHEGPGVRGPALHIELRRPALPEYLERPQIVRRVEDGRLEVAETERWGGSLVKMVSSTLAENLAHRLPASEVYTEAGAISARADVRIEIDVRRFELSADGDVELDAQVALHWKPAGDRTVLERIRLAKQPDSTSAEAVVATMSELLGELSKALAELVAAGPPAAAGDPAGTAGESTSTLAP